jgi:hypothetical protein
LNWPLDSCEPQQAPDRGCVELGRATCLGARVEVVDGAAGRQLQRVLVVGRLGRGLVRDRVQVGATVRLARTGVGLGVGAAGLEVVAVRLGVVGVGVEDAIGVEALGAVRRIPPLLLEKAGKCRLFSFQ